MLSLLLVKTVNWVHSAFIFYWTNHRIAFISNRRCKRNVKLVTPRSLEWRPRFNRPFPDRIEGVGEWSRDRGANKTVSQTP